MHEDRGEKRRAEQPKILRLAQLEVQHGDDARLRADRVVDDPLRQLQRQKKEWKQKASDRKQDELVAFRVLPDELKQCFFYSSAPRGGLRLFDPCRQSTRQWRYSPNVFS